MSDPFLKLFTINHFNIMWFIVMSTFTGLLYSKLVYVLYPFKKLKEKAFPRKSDICGNKYPAAMIVVPSLLRDEFDHIEIIGAIDSAAKNNYPGELHIIASVDGYTENPKQYEALVNWINTQKYSNNIHLHITNNIIRRGKQMAIDAAINYMIDFVKQNKIVMPPIYFSLDADETIDDGSLRFLVERLMTKHWLTGNYRRLITAHVVINKGIMWKDWKSFFTNKGQMYLYAARGFFSFNPLQENTNILPIPTVLGQLFCTWSDVMIQAPRFMGYLQTIKNSDWIKWWFGVEPPKFSDYTGESLPQALCGNTDDTSIAMIVNMCWWNNGKLSWDFPATPLHSFCRMLKDIFIERVQDHESRAKVNTFMPPAMKGLWAQRVRWFSCRPETNGRFWRSFQFNWSVAIPFYLNLSQLISPTISIVFFYVILPFVVWSHWSVITWSIYLFVIAYVTQFWYLFMVWIFDEKRSQFTHLIITYFIPTTRFYQIIFFHFTMFVGVFQDVCWNGCNVKFYTSKTLIDSRASRIAIAYRVRRFFNCLWRSIRYGDIEFGSFWWSWQAYPKYNLTNGFTGWTKDNKSDYILR